MSGDPIKRGSLHHPHGYNTPSSSASAHSSPYAPGQPHPFSSTHGLSREFAVPAIPQHARALAVHRGSPLGPSPPLAPAGPVPSVGAKRGRRPYAGERHDAIWSPDVQEAFLQAARAIPNNGKNWIMRDGRQYGRNALIAEEIHRLTGQHRTRQQISSHIQVLKKVHADDPNMMRILNGQLDETSSSAAGTSTAPCSRVSSSSTSPPAIVKTENSVSPPPMPNIEPIEGLLDGRPFMSIIRSSAPGSVTSDASLPGTPQSPQSGSHTDPKSEQVQIAELLPRGDIPPSISMSRVLTEPLAADRPEGMAHPRAWRGERLAYITAITIWAEKTLKDAGVRSRPTTTHVFAQMHSASCPLEPLAPDMEEIVRQIQPGTCMHAEIGIALPPAGLEVGKIRSTLVVEAMKEFDGYCLTDAFCGREGRFMSTHTAVVPTGREAREKYSWTYEIPFATEVWRKVFKEQPNGVHGMRLVQKYVRGLAGGNRDGDLNVSLMVVHDIKVVPPGEVGYSRIKHVDLTGEQAKHDALGVQLSVVDDDSSESGDADGDVEMEDDEAESKRDKPNLSVAIPPAEPGAQFRTRATHLANQGSQPVTPFEQMVHTPQQPPPLSNRSRDDHRGWWAPTPIEGGMPGMQDKISLENQMNGILGHALGDGGNRVAWLTRDALAAGTPTLAEYAGREQALDAPVRIERNEYFG